MKKISLLLFLLCCFASFAQDNVRVTAAYDGRPQIAYDGNGNLLDNATSHNLAFNREREGISGWSFERNDTIVTEFSNNLYQRGQVNYKSIKDIVEQLTDKEFSEETIFLLGYTFADDFCTYPTEDNVWDRKRIDDMKIHRTNQKKRIEKTYEHVVYIHFFEQGIVLKNNKRSRREYFYQDNENLLRNRIFRDQAVCGSYAILKPNGALLIRNGEYRPDEMATHLRTKNWESFFEGAE